MKPIRMFTMASCPHCRRALQWMAELQQENPAFSALSIEIIDETVHPDIARQFDYYYVPTYYIENSKVHEGVPTKDAIREVFRKAGT